MKVTGAEKKRIAFTQGQGELPPAELQAAINQLSELFLIDFIEPNSATLTDYSALVVAQPKTEFSEAARYKLDQYLMQGGSALFLLDKVSLNADSLPQGGTYAFPIDLSFEDLLFRYGVRLNTNLVQDLQMSKLQMVTGRRGNQPNIQALPWPYTFYATTFSNHPSVRNLDAVKFSYASSLDTVKADGVAKIPLVFTTRYGRTRNMPQQVTLDEIKTLKQDQATFNQPQVLLGLLLEGRFTSAYANRFVPKPFNTEQRLKQSVPTKLAVVADGDLLRSTPDFRGRLVPPDYDPVQQQALSNIDFASNLLVYLTDYQGLIASRSKEIEMRPLDILRWREEKTYWQLLNLALPIVLLVGLGIVVNLWRKRHYGKQ